MKTIIVNHPRKNREKYDNTRFQNMLAAMELGGIEGSYNIIHTERRLLELLNSEKPDMVYSAKYYVSDESGSPISIHKMLDKLDVPYIGSSPESLELVLSKVRMKEKWQNDYILTPKFFKIYKSDLSVGSESVIRDNDFPYILKPNKEGNSRGLDQTSVVFDSSSLEAKLRDLLQRYDTVLVEKYLGNASSFYEYTVAAIGNGSNKLLMPAEIKLKQKKRIRIVTNDDKNNSLTQVEHVTDPVLIKMLTDFAYKAFESANIRDYARLDVIMADDKLYAIEINGLPMIPDRWFEICARGLSLNSEQYINAIILAGLARNIASGKTGLQIPSQLSKVLPNSIYAKLTDI